ncbi:14.7 kDa ribonuclease H-like protein [Juglans microcarpa x Juglans regia]|uniref:14.7 kDa ribonuclease H-like protein n=1 Tax=Juglans microcarpa x Juglans regia TaxID=2249226 RepID=UPI001B7E815D|nr:14.7 kDa ribonuclease H-like protein [Juglans microcarpa x Juglans regia]
MEGKELMEQETALSDCEIKVWGSDAHRRRSYELYWKKPSVGRIKLNIDGSSLGNPGASGAGGVLWASYGNIVLAFSKNLDAGTNTSAELRAMVFGLRYCRDMGFQGIDVESDLQVCVRFKEVEEYNPEDVSIFDLHGVMKLKRELCEANVM